MNLYQERVAIEKKKLSDFRKGKTWIQLCGEEGAKKLMEAHMQDLASRDPAWKQKCAHLQKWITNGVESLLIPRNALLPTGFFPGRNLLEE